MLKIALVNDNDEIIGYSDKAEVHKKGILHRAFSILIYNSNGEMLIHRRAEGKYHSGGLWTNACCSHQYKGMDIYESAHLRLFEEMALKADLEYKFKFRYYIEFENNMKENEIDYVFVGYCDDTPTPIAEEVAECCWINPDILKQDIKNHPEKYTFWFKRILEELEG
ncbi:MAG: isopentenyl-diphosphate Delta-isomerase [Candidatus Kapabacteria bacterium]|nr:isopentenyl-diphosphate Delta-isomerase [Candidatus Kapabacteria bacterium]